MTDNKKNEDAGNSAVYALEKMIKAQYHNMIWIKKIDVKILKYIQDKYKSKFMDKAMKFITMLGDGGMLWIAIATLLLFYNRSRIYGSMIVSVLCLGLITGNFIMKPIAARLRPFMEFPDAVELHIVPPKDFSFPSAHSMSSFACATVITFINIPIGIICLTIAALIAFSRLYLFVHYPSDVLVGTLYGIFLAFVVKFIFAHYDIIVL